MRKLLFHLFFVETLFVLDSEEFNNEHKNIICKFQKDMKDEYEELICKVEDLEYFLSKFNYKEIMMYLNILKDVNITHIIFRSTIMNVINKVQRNYYTIGNNLEAKYDIQSVGSKLWRLYGFFEANILLKGYKHLEKVKSHDKNVDLSAFDLYLDNFMLELQKLDAENVKGLNGYFGRNQIIELIVEAKKAKNIYKFAKIVKALLEISDAYQNMDILNRRVHMYWPVYELKYNILMQLIKK